jgi:4-diphosphocytidyl-2-C-methyl-D-erythritol kinase
VSASRSVSLAAHAKINVFLRILGRRDDGFHDVETLVLPISLHDDLRVSSLARNEVDVRVQGDPELTASVPIDPGVNLATRAVLLAAGDHRAAGGEGVGASIELTKRIPVAAGLGGGSADAAAALRAVHELWGTDEGRSAAIALELGSDVPAMLMGGPVLVGGRGDRLDPVHAVATWWVLRPFGFGVSAADAYRWWDEDGMVSGPDPGALLAAVETGDVELMGDALANDLQTPVVARHPAIADALDECAGLGALGAVMSGSGPTVAALARDREHARELAAAIPGSLVVSGPPDVAPGPS